MPAMACSPVETDPMHRPRVVQWARYAVLALLVAGALVMLWIFLFTPLGAQVRQHPDQFAGHARQWVAGHWLTAPAVLVVVYVVLAILLAPVWWLQVLAGFAFGAVWGTALCLAGAVVASLLSVGLSRWLVGQAMHNLEAHRDRLRRLDEKLGHNGLLVVLVLRMFPVLIPFSIANYLLGATRIRQIDVALGTALGTLPHVAMTVTLGAHPALAKDWRFWVAIAAGFILIATPAALRYHRSRWLGRHDIRRRPNPPVS